MSQQFNLWTGQPEPDDSLARDLVYGPSNSGNGLVFIQRVKAMILAKIWDALSSSTTWGEFRVSVGERIYQHILNRGQFDGC
jgi:hypothetical protein